MKKIRKPILLVLIFSMIFSVNAGAFRLLDSVYLTSAVDLGVSIPLINNKDCIVTVEDGKEILYTTSGGSPSILQVYNLTDHVLLDTKTVLGKICWMHKVDSKGTVYLILDGYVSRYFPKEKRLESLGRVPDNTASYSFCFDDEENFYIGVFPQGKIMKYNEKKSQFETFFTLGNGYQYLRNVAYKSGFFYATTFDNERGSFVLKINAQNASDYQYLNLPLQEGDMMTDGFLTVVDKYLVINSRCKLSRPFMVYNTETGTFVDHGYKGNFKGLNCTPIYQDKVYFTATDGTFHSFNIKTEKVENEGFKMLSSYDTTGGGFITVPNDPNFPNKSYICVLPGRDFPIIVNFETKKVREYTEVVLPGSNASYQTIKSSEGDNAIAVGGFASPNAGYYHIDSGYMDIMKAHQVHTAHKFNGKIYYGYYSGGYILEYDPTKPIDNVKNPRTVKQIGQDQDRPFGMSSGDGKLFLGAVPGYFKLGGALTIYDGENWEVYRNIVQDQSIITTMYKDGYLYGGTSVFGGLGLPPTSTRAKIFIWDVKNKKVIKEFDPKLKGINYDITCYGKIALGPDGNIWVGAANLIFAFDPETFEIKKQLELAKPYDTNVMNFYPVMMEFDKRGILYYWIHKNSDIEENNFYMINPHTMQYRNISEYDNRVQYCRDMTIADDGNIYYSTGNTLKMIGIFDTEFKLEDIKISISNLKGNLALFINKPYAIKNGKVVQIDESNIEIKPVIQNERTMVPVRFIAESLGAAVEWKEETSTILMKKENITIELKLDSGKIKVNGRIKSIDAPVSTINDRTMLPLRSVVEAFGSKLFWDDSGLIVIGEKEFKTSKENLEKIKITMQNYLFYQYKEQLKQDN